MSPELLKIPVKINLAWCKACGICMEVCPKKVITADKRGKAVVTYPEACIKCKICEMSCPDFAIVVDTSKEREVEDNE